MSFYKVLIFGVIHSVVSCHGIVEDEGIKNVSGFLEVAKLDSNYSDLSHNFDKKMEIEKRETVLPNQVITIPLGAIYSDNIINLIKSKSYNESASDLIMGFCIDESNSIILANNNKRIFQFYNLANGHLKDSIKYPSVITKDYIDPISRIFLNDNVLYCATYNNTFQIDLSSEKVLKEEESSFGKNQNKKLRLMTRQKFQLLDKISDLNLENLPDSGLDIIVDKMTNTEYVLYIENGGLKFYDNENTLELKIDFESANFIDVDFLYSDNSEMGFVLKSDLTEIESDLYVLYDLEKNDVKYMRELQSYKEGVESQLGDPICFPTGNSYLMDANNIIWRMRTTIEGVYIENWEIRSSGSPN